MRVRMATVTVWTTITTKGSLLLLRKTEARSNGTESQEGQQEAELLQWEEVECHATEQSQYPKET